MSVVDLRFLLDLYRVTGKQQRAELVAIARAARAWSSHRYRNILPPAHLDYLALEAAAARVTGYYPMVLPPLLQTEAYAQSAISAVAPDADPEPLLQAHLHHQRLLDRREPPPPRLRFLVDEGVLHRIGDGEVMVEQLCHLGKLAEHPQVDQRIIPFKAGLHSAVFGGAFAFVHLDGDAEPLLFVGNGLEFAARNQSDATGHHRGIPAALEAVAVPVASAEDLAPVLDQVVEADTGPGT